MNMELSQIVISSLFAVAAILLIVNAEKIRNSRFWLLGAVSYVSCIFGASPLLVLLLNSMGMK